MRPLLLTLAFLPALLAGCASRDPFQMGPPLEDLFKQLNLPVKPWTSKASLKS